MRLAAVVLLAALPADAWQEADPVFRTGTLLVQVDVVVHKGSDAVRDLTKDDFQVFDNGQRQEIAVFVKRESEAQPAAARELPRGYRMNRPVLTGTEPVTATVLLIDRLNTTPADQIWVNKKTAEYLERAGLNEYIAIFSMNLGLRQVHDFSKDRASLLRAFRESLAEPRGIDAETKGDAPPPEDEFMNLQRRRDVVTGSFANLSAYLRGLPGRKKVVWITSSMPLYKKVRVGQAIQTFVIFDATEELFAAARQLNDANTSLYPVNPKALLAPEDTTDESINTMIRLAEITGGKPYYGFTDTDRGIEEAVNDTEVTYTLGFYAAEGQDAKLDQSHKLDVKVARGGVNVRYRRSYTPAAKTQPVAANRAQRTLDEWLQNSFEATEIPIAAIARRVANVPGNYAVEVQVDLSAVVLEQRGGRWRGTLDLAISPDAKGKVKGLHQVVKLSLTEQQYVDALTNGFVVVNPYKGVDDKGEMIASGLHIAVLDRATGRAGSVRVPLEQPR